MKNTLIITLGNSEIQFNKNNLQEFKLEINNKSMYLQMDDLKIKVKENRNYKNWLLPVSSRYDGEIILKNYNKFKPIIKYALIEPLIEEIGKNNTNIDEIIWVYTDQEDKEFRFSDTIFYAEIFKKWISERYGDKISQKYIPVQKNVKDIDYQYRNFYGLFGNLIKDSDKIENIYLFAQGGIDQINHALTLQLLQKYKDKVHLLQKAEKENIKELQFPKLFLKDLTKQKFIKYIEDYDFQKAADVLFSSGFEKKICYIAALRLQLNYERMPPKADSYFKKNEIERLGNELLEKLMINKKSSRSDVSKLKLIDLYHSINIAIKNKEFKIALIRYFTLFENLFRVLLELEFNIPNLFKYYNPEIDSKSSNKKFEKQLLSIDKGCLNYFKDNKIWYNNPNRILFQEFYLYLLEKNKKFESTLTIKELKNLFDIIKKLAGARNNVAHRLSSLTEKQFNNLFLNINKGQLDIIVHKLLSINSKFGMYDEIKRRMLDNIF